MKSLNLIILTIILALGQWASLDHAYHDHQENEVCEYCLSIKPLEHTATGSSYHIPSSSHSQWHFELVTTIDVLGSASYFAARAPPRFI